MYINFTQKKTKHDFYMLNGYFFLKEARGNYKIIFTEASERLAQAAEKRRKPIQRARVYFELKEEAKRVKMLHRGG